MSDAYSCYLDEPYPEIRTEGRNTAYAAILTCALAGQVSEMTAVVQYIFQHVISRNERISKAMAGIANVEMKHYDILSELIFDLGGTPKLAVQNGCAQKFWMGQFADYSTEPKAFLKNNIAAETAAIALYNKNILQIEDCYVRENLRRIILDEEHHIEIFNELLSDICFC